LSGKVHLQACDNKACYFPEDLKWKLETHIAAPDENVTPQNPELFQDTNPAPPPPPSNRSPPPPKLSAADTSSLVPWIPFSDDQLESLRGGSPASRKPGPPPIDVGDSAENWSLPLALLIAFCVGLIFNVMPCVLPVLPIKAIGFYEVAQHH